MVDKDELIPLFIRAEEVLGEFAIPSIEDRQGEYIGEMTGQQIHDLWVEMVHVIQRLETDNPDRDYMLATEELDRQER